MILLFLTNKKKRGRNIIAQIIKEKAENRRNILIELEDLADDIMFKEIETDLYESIAKLSRINKNDALKTKKEIRKEKRLNQDLETTWIYRQSQSFWTPGMIFNECKTSIYRFHPSHDITNYLR